MDGGETGERRHDANVARFEAIENRLTVIETTMKDALGVLKFLGGAGVLLLTINVLAHWLG